MTELIHALAALLYACAAFLGWRAPRAGGRARAVPGLLAVCAVGHVAGIVALHREVPPVPLDSFPAALSLIGWLIVVSYLLSIRFVRVRGVESWVAAVAALFTGVACLGLVFAPPTDAVREATSWSHAHVLLSTLGFSLLALASLAGVAYLAKKRSLKRKSAAGLGLPSLESLDRMEHLTLSVGFSLLTLGVLTGFTWGLSRGVDIWTLHSLWLLAAWCVYLRPVGLRVVRGQHGDRPARSVVLGFAVLAFSYIGIRLLGGGA